jgi:ABC-type uncharacterized transport system permease subunit
MKLFMGVFVAFVISCLIGWIVYITTDSETASYIVGVISLALGAGGLVVAFQTSVGQRIRSKVIRSKVKVRNIDDSTVIGAKTKKDGSGSISTDVDAQSVKNKSKVIGVEET